MGKNNNMAHLTDLEFQDNTTKKDTARATTTQDATEEDATEEDRASEEDAEVVTEEEVTPRDAESFTVKMVKLQERTELENIFICICSFFAVNKLVNQKKK